MNNDFFNESEDNDFELDKYKSRSSSSSKSSVLQFFSGIILFLIGAYLITQNTIIYTNFSALSDVLGFNMPFGLIILPLLIGIGILFFNSKSVLGWIVLVFGILSILLGILMALKIQFKPITLYFGILMYGMTAAGLGLFLKSIFGGGKR
ncbi:MAG: hypothetical protein ACOYWZ_11275 [Bacillota bacterium]